jgi:hypothetical protein
MSSNCVTDSSKASSGRACSISKHLISAISLFLGNSLKLVVKDKEEPDSVRSKPRKFPVTVLPAFLSIKGCSEKLPVEV